MKRSLRNSTISKKTLSPPKQDTILIKKKEEQDKILNFIKKYIEDKNKEDKNTIINESEEISKLTELTIFKFIKKQIINNDDKKKLIPFIMANSLSKFYLLSHIQEINISFKKLFYLITLTITNIYYNEFNSDLDIYFDNDEFKEKLLETQIPEIILNIDYLKDSLVKQQFPFISETFEIEEDTIKVKGGEGFFDDNIKNNLVYIITTFIRQISENCMNIYTLDNKGQTSEEILNILMNHNNISITTKQKQQIKKEIEIFLRNLSTILIYKINDIEVSNLRTNEEFIKKSEFKICITNVNLGVASNRNKLFNNINEFTDKKYALCLDDSDFIGFDEKYKKCYDELESRISTDDLQKGFAPPNQGTNGQHISFWTKIIPVEKLKYYKNFCADICEDGITGIRQNIYNDFNDLELNVIKKIKKNEKNEEDEEDKKDKKDKKNKKDKTYSYMNYNEKGLNPHYNPPSIIIIVFDRKRQKLTTLDYLLTYDNYSEIFQYYNNNSIADRILLYYSPIILPRDITIKITKILNKIDPTWDEYFEFFKKSCQTCGYVFVKYNYFIKIKPNLNLDGYISFEDYYQLFGKENNFYDRLIDTLKFTTKRPTKDTKINFTDDLNDIKKENLLHKKVKEKLNILKDKEKKGITVTKLPVIKIVKKNDENENDKKDNEKNTVSSYFYQGLNTDLFYDKEKEYFYLKTKTDYKYCDIYFLYNICHLLSFVEGDLRVYVNLSNQQLKNSIFKKKEFKNDDYELSRYVPKLFSYQAMSEIITNEEILSKINFTKKTNSNELYLGLLLTNQTEKYIEYAKLFDETKENKFNINAYNTCIEYIYGEQYKNFITENDYNIIWISPKSIVNKTVTLLKRTIPNTKDNFIIHDKKIISNSSVYGGEFIMKSIVNYLFILLFVFILICIIIIIIKVIKLYNKNQTPIK